LSRGYIDGSTGRIVLANQAAARMFGFDFPEDMVATNPLDYIPLEDREHVASMMSEYMFEKDQRKVIELRALRKDGTSIWLSAIGVKTEYQGTLAGLVSLRDVTGRAMQGEVAGTGASEIKWHCGSMLVLQALVCLA
jgi:PAS domain S-box-containing protein